MVHFDQSGHSIWSVRLKCPFPFDQIVVPRIALLYPVYKYNNQMHGGLVESVQLEYTVSLDTWNFGNLTRNYIVVWKAPFFL